MLEKRMGIFRKFIAATIIFSLTAFFAPVETFASTFNRYLAVDYVMDGDSVVAEGKGIRYLGIDAPEYGERGFKAAKDINKKLVVGKKVKFSICREEPKDKYGRILAWAYVGGLDISAYLVKEGYARILPISKCAKERYMELKKLEDLARKSRKGIWK